MNSEKSYTLTGCVPTVNGAMITLVVNKMHQPLSMQALVHAHPKETNDCGRNTLDTDVFDLLQNQI